MGIAVEQTRIAKLRTYLFEVINELVVDEKYQINANMLALDVNNYSLDRIPVAPVIEKWVTGEKLCREVYSLRSRNNYSQDAINNLKNVGFFEKFEEKISQKNMDKQLPSIDRVESIACLNCGTMTSENTKTAEFEIQIEIQYTEV